MNKEDEANQLHISNIKLNKKIAYLTMFADMLQEEDLPSLDSLTEDLSHHEAELIQTVKRGQLLGQRIARGRDKLQAAKEQVQRATQAKLESRRRIELVKHELARVLPQLTSQSLPEQLQHLHGFVARLGVSTPASPSHCLELKQYNRVLKKMGRKIERDRFSITTDKKKQARFDCENEHLLKSLYDLQYENQALKQSERRLQGEIEKVQVPLILKRGVPKLRQSHQKLPFQMYKEESLKRLSKSTSLASETCSSQFPDLVRTISLHGGRPS
jgi:hypothetical protein